MNLTTEKAKRVLRVKQFVDKNPECGRVGVARGLNITESEARWALNYIRQGLPIPGEDCDLADTETAKTVMDETHEILTLEQLLEKTKVDQKRWKVTRFVVNKWEIGAKHPRTGEILKKPLFQVKAWLAPREPEATIEDIQAEFINALRLQAPAPPKKVPRANNKGMLELSIFDLHLGQTSWKPETGAHWCPEDAETHFRDAIQHLVEKGHAFGFDRILLPLGNDFFNVDSLHRATTNGTPQDEAIRWQESFARGKAMTVRAIEELSKNWPVDVVIISGNHDMQRAFYLGEVLDAYFGRMAHVTVNNTPTLRKYVRYGRNLLGFTHGKDEQVRDLGLIMAAERGMDWAETAFREWHVGHLHHRKSSEIKTGDESHNVRHRVIPSLCGRDAWHAAKGYLAIRAAEAFIWRHSGGCEANISYYPDQV